MISAFGIDHGEIYKANVKFGEYGWNSKEGRKRSMKEIKADSRIKAGHGNKQRVAAHTGVWTGLGAATGLGSTAGLGMSPKGKAAATGVGAGVGAGLGVLSGKGENLQRSAQRNVGHAVRRGDIRRVKPGERTTSFSNTIVKD